MKAIMREKLLIIGWYFYDRLMEPSSWKGVILIVSGGGWKALDGSNKGELVAQWGMILLGTLQFFMPQKTQYATTKPKSFSS